MTQIDHQQRLLDIKNLLDSNPTMTLQSLGNKLGVTRQRALQLARQVDWNAKQRQEARRASKPIQWSTRFFAQSMRQHLLDSGSYQCHMCHMVKPLSEFSPSYLAKANDLGCVKCKTCNCELQKKYR